jgi:hypothetical protein
LDGRNSKEELGRQGRERKERRRRGEREDGGRKAED